MDRAASATGRHRRRSHGAPRTGFTLLELVLVIGLLVILAAFAWPYVATQFDRSALPESADQFCALIRMTRAAAMLDGRRYRIRFEPQARHPFIEYEREPLTEPGVYTAVKTDWGSEEWLLGEVEVHEIRAGRPEYTLPYDEEAENEDEPAIVSDEQAVETDAAPIEPAPVDETIDERRPAVTFDPSGATDWATIILAEKPSDEELAEDDRQIWIELDGRTGQARVRDPVTDAELADVSLRTPAAKLQPPEIVFATEDQSTVGQENEEAGAEGFMNGGQFPGGLPSGMGQLGGGEGGKSPDGRSPGEQGDPDDAGEDDSRDNGNESNDNADNQSDNNANDNESNGNDDNDNNSNANDNDEDNQNGNEENSNEDNDNDESNENADGNENVNDNVDGADEDDEADENANENTNANDNGNDNADPR